MKNILVTGANGGMGKATCKLLTSLGYNVYGIDVSDAKECFCTQFFKVDLTDFEQIIKAKEQLSTKIDNLYAIIHLAGIYDLNSLIEMSETDFKRVFEVNFFSVYRINKAFMPMLEKGSKIIITSSELAPLNPLPFTGVYAISKCAVEKYAFSLRMELNLLKIKVCLLRPGAVKTGLLNASTTALDKFCDNTKLYPCNAKRFKKIVNSVENKCVAPEKIAKVLSKIVKKKNPKYVYNVNRNFLLRLLSALPKKFQVKIISQILKDK